MTRLMIGAAMLRSSAFEEIVADRDALTPAIGIVILVALFSVIAGVLGSVISGEEQLVGLLWLVLTGILVDLLRWALWGTLLLFVGAGMLSTSATQTNWGELGRVVGFAYTPSLLNLFWVIPVVGGAIYLIASCWTLAAVVVGVRQALDYGSIGRAILVTVIAGIIAAIPWLILEVIERVTT